MRALLIGAPYDPSALDIDGVLPPSSRRPIYWMPIPASTVGKQTIWGEWLRTQRRCPRLTSSIGPAMQAHYSDDPIFSGQGRIVNKKENRLTYRCPLAKLISHSNEISSVMRRHSNLMPCQER
jgi:hypothetical protein